MQINLATNLQVHIANLLWAAEDTETVKDILLTFGKEGQVVYNMMLAEAFDTMEDTDIAADILTEIFKK